MLDDLVTFHSSQIYIFKNFKLIENFKIIF